MTTPLTAIMHLSNGKLSVREWMHGIYLNSVYGVYVERTGGWA